MRHKTQLAIAALACIALGFGGVTAVQAVVDDRPTANEHSHSSDPDREDPTSAEPGTDTVEASAEDPRGEGPPWSVVVYRSKDGRTCAAAGRKVNGRVGALNSGRFTEYPIHEGGTCVDLTAVPAGAQVRAGTGPEDRIIVHGVAGPKVRTIEVSSRSGAAVVDIGPRGGFVTALQPGTALAQVRVVAILKDGQRITLL
ncbi:MAG: hypothetical protein AVDCRST_MAG85-2565 [uncultured Solirubrobacteraceae bacterium]|uniref:Uncharacterized protein n=1 Tax=uncultured Solirubrobacteraceae bacterium TaxID=1162706 RepID=A0A6J4T6D6_9ACTN|nr:MAG: hypothetical protein AVDCRST_MAG85-2565 [uncultured Solirubrobacteraceae bacterium]